MSETVLQAVERLAGRVLKGEVVFFVGSGFSIDSEGNTAVRLMTRLLIRFTALHRVLSDPKILAAGGGNDGAEGSGRLAQIVTGLRENLKQTFGLSATARGSFPWTRPAKNETRESDVRILAREYYAANDWFCSAFQRMLELIAVLRIRPRQRKGLLARVGHAEERIRLQSNGDRQPLDPSPLGTPPYEELLKWVIESPKTHGRDAGKALFLDTMGFADDAVMGGEPAAADARQLVRSYRNKLFDRHHVLARLAREGLCPIVLTTNYDLLLEGAWRLAGFNSARTSAATAESWFPDVPWEHVARIGSPVDFIKAGKAVRTSLVVKVHGCADLYRKKRRETLDAPKQNRNLQRLDRSASESWRRYLESMVFTYREIQNWRHDSWARDFLTTLQRTRTMVFIGYSLQDPVIHDTFRTIYEEMAQQRQHAEAIQSDGQLKPEDAPAFFFAPQDGTQSFHGAEVLNAATFALGAEPRHIRDHENYLRFHFRNERSTASGRFPNLDDLFRWLFHCVARQRQRQSLEYRLCGVATTLLNRRARPSELTAILGSFDEIVKSESQEMDRVWQVAENCRDEAEKEKDRSARSRLDAKATLAATAARLRLTRITAWTRDFHPSLLQEFACCDLVHRNGGPGLSLEIVRGSPWYFPFSANLGWTAWATVVELAVRRLVAAAAGLVRPHDACGVRAEFYPVPARFPRVLFQRGSCNSQCSPGWLESLTIQTGSFDEPIEMRDSLSGAGRHTVWTLRTNGAPWHETQETESRKSPSRLGLSRQLAPNAEALWGIALGKTNDGVAKYLGDAVNT